MGDHISTYKDYVAGMAAGVATVIIGHPFDTVKVKLQKHNTEAHGVKYRSALHCTTRILKNEGVRGLYRGATSSFIGVAVESSILFGIYSQTKKSLQGELNSSKPQLRFIIPSAAYGGAIISLVLCSSELVKCRMQVQGTDSLVGKCDKYSSPLDCAVKTIKSEGLKGIFRGGTATLLRESVGNVIFFSTYEYTRYYMYMQVNSASSVNSHLPNILIDAGIGTITGGLGGVAYWSVVLPFDVAKTVIQTAPDSTSSRNPFRILSSDEGN
uniref:Mitochondrial arginine transporter BAC1 n=1 Tax=Nelumbo nucifera TaxID=4432 RepID=A0A822XUI1_NELNU|nr:TPA_asm: hypothetical protein HUJ06_024294 [Nelumbo nucifera]